MPLTAYLHLTVEHPLIALASNWLRRASAAHNLKHSAWKRGLVMAIGVCGLVAGASATPYAYIANSNDNTVSVIDTATNTVVTTVAVGSDPLGVAVSSDGTRAYVTNSVSNSVSVINTVTNTVVATVAVGTSPHAVAVSTDGTRAYVANYTSKNVSVIDTSAYTVVATIDVGFYLDGVAVSPDGTRVYVTNNDFHSISVIDTSNNSVVTSGFMGQSPVGVAVSPDGTRVYVTNRNSNNVSVIDIATNNEVIRVAVGNRPDVVAISPDGTRVYVVNFGSNNVSVIDTSTHTVVTTVAVGNFPDGVAVTPDGTRVYVTNKGSNSVSVINTSTNTVVATVLVGAGPTGRGKFIGITPVPPPPAAPTAPIAAAGNASANVGFAAPASNGNAITGYTVTSIPAGGVDSNAGSTALLHSITGLTNGTAYTFTVTASSVAGTSNASPASNSVTPVGIPATPAAPTATAGNAMASVSFVSPASNGSVITGYSVTRSGGGTTSCSVSPCNITGLTNGTTYTFTLSATNGQGTSGASPASNAVTPGAPASVPTTPVAPTATAGNATASVSFVAPSNNGSAITGYTVTSIPAGGVDSNAGSTALTHSMTGLTNGTAYTFTVTATNGAGTSTASPVSNSVTPAASVAPPAPTPPPPLTPTIPVFPISIGGVNTLPAIVNLSSGVGPTFTSGIVGLLSTALGTPLRFVEQNAQGAVTLSGFNGGMLSFTPHGFQTGDSRANGIYPVGNGQYQLVSNGQSLVIAPAVVHLDQLTPLLPGVSAKVGDNGVITATLNGVIYAVQPGVAVVQEAASGSARILQGSDGVMHFIDAQGNNQVLNPAFGEPANLRSVLQGLYAGSTLSIQLDGTASIMLNGKVYSLVPDMTLGGVPADRVGQAWWQESDTRYRLLNLQTPGTSQGFTVRP